MIQKAAKGLSYLLIVKVLSKILDFSLNVLIARKIEENVLGIYLMRFFYIYPSNNYFRFDYAFESIVQLLPFLCKALP